MADTKTLIEQAYSAFNKRDIDGALALMTQDVSWPKASEGGKVVGKEEIRAYWRRQWGEFDPHDLPPVVRPPLEFSHAERQLIGASERVSGAGGRYPSALCGRCVLY